MKTGSRFVAPNSETRATTRGPRARRLLVIALAGVTTILAGCRGKYGVNCGREASASRSGYEARECLWSAYQSGRRAHFSTTRLTQEGDPIVYELRVISRGRVEVREDSRDRFGSPGITTFRCRGMERARSADPTDTRLYFELTGCPSERGRVLL